MGATTQLDNNLLKSVNYTTENALSRQKIRDVGSSYEYSIYLARLLDVIRILSGFLAAAGGAVLPSPALGAVL